MIKRYDVRNLLLDDEPILKNVLTYREVKKKHRSKSGGRAGQIRKVNKRKRTDSFFNFFI